MQAPVIARTKSDWMVQWISFNTNWSSGTLKEGFLCGSQQVTCRMPWDLNWNWCISRFLFTFLFSVAWERPAFSFFSLCSADIKHFLLHPRMPLKMGFTCWMAPQKFQGFIYMGNLSLWISSPGKRMGPLAHWWWPSLLPLICVRWHDTCLPDLCPSSLMPVNIFHSCCLMVISPFPFNVFLLNWDELELQCRGLKEQLQVD